jgi:putative ABC transport system permease protein
VLQSDAGVIPGRALAEARSVDGLASAVGVADTTVLVHLSLGDGAKRNPRVVAIYKRGLGFGDALLPAAAVTGHVTNPGLASVLIDVTQGDRAATVAARLRARLAAYPGLTVGDRAAVVNTR